MEGLAATNIARGVSAMSIAGYTVEGRREDDFYGTPPEATEALVPLLRCRRPDTSPVRLTS